MKNADKKFPFKEIEFSELRRAVDMIFDHIENDLKLKKIRLDHDYYADMGLDEKFESISGPDVGAGFPDNVELVIGQLYDDWEFLENMIRDDSVCALMFEHVAPLLRYIGYKAQEQAYAARC